MPPFTLLVGNLKKSVTDVDALMQEYGPDVAYVDASYLLHSAAGEAFKGKPWESARDVMRGLKDLAQRLNRPIFQSVQFNRAQKEDVAMSLDNIGQTDEIGQLSSIVIGIRRGASPNERIQRRFKIIKNRHGRDMIDFTTRFEFSPFNMDEIVEDARDPEGDWDGNMGEAPAHNGET